MAKDKAPAHQTSNLIHLIGTDAAGIENLPTSLKNLILNSTTISAPKRILKEIPNWWENSKSNRPLPELFETNKPEKLIDWLKKQKKPTIVLASGDPLWFGIGNTLLKSFPRNQLVFHPSPTSLQLAFARLGRPWHNASWISLHGRDPSPLAQKLRKRPESLAVIPDPSRGGAEEVRQYLLSSGLAANYDFWVCEQLGHQEEKVRNFHPLNELPKDLNPLHIVVLIEKEKVHFISKKIPLFGIDDGIYLQNKGRPGLMTKREIRIQLIADLELPKIGVIWDIGAGVGSIGLEAIRLSPELKLLAIEKRTGSREIIQENARRLSVKPEKIIESEALEAISTLSKDLINPDRVILGGGGGGGSNGPSKKTLLEAILKNLKPKGIVVIPLVTLESLSELLEILKSSDLTTSVSQHQSWRGVSIGNGTRLEPLNPVYILKAK